MEVSAEVWAWFGRHTDHDHAKNRDDCAQCQYIIQVYGPMPPLDQLIAMHTVWQREHWPTRNRRKSHIPENLRWAVWERDNFTCQQCGIRRYLTIDHILPKSKGGPCVFDNLQTLCRNCNSLKGDNV